MKSKCCLILLIPLIGIAYADSCQDLVNRCERSYFGKLVGHDTTGEIACYDSIIKLNPKCAEAWYKKGLMIGDNNEALKCINESIKLEPKNSNYWLEKGEILKNMKRFNESASAFSEVARLNPDSVSALYQKGLALYNANRYQESIASYDEALKMLDSDESYNDQMVMNIWNSKGDVYTALRQKAKAEEAYSEANKLEEKIREESEAERNESGLNTQDMQGPIQSTVQGQAPMQSGVQAPVQSPMVNSQRNVQIGL